MSRRQNTVFIFEHNGKFLSKIKSIGKGPGEYIHISDIDINEKDQELYILDWDGGKICNYDLKGNFLRDIKLNNMYSDVCRIHTSNIN